MADNLGQVYDRMAPFYYLVFGFSLEGARKRALQLAKIQSHEKILEVGVGTGLTFKHLPEDADLTGVDLSEKMLEQAKERAADLGRNYKLLQMDATQLKFPDESFDLVISAHFLSATSNPLPALLEMKRVLKKNGRILLVNNFQRKDPHQLLNPVAAFFGFNLKLNLQDLCDKSGLHIHKEEKVSRLLPIDGVILIP